LVLYWKRCSICGRYEPIDACSMHPSVNVCPWCCILCSERSNCSKPTWFTEVKVIEAKEVEVKERIEREKRIRTLLEELMSKLE